jgi:hypothetical protein
MSTGVCRLLILDRIATVLGSGVDCGSCSLEEFSFRQGVRSMRPFERIQRVGVNQHTIMKQGSGRLNSALEPL